MQAAKLQTPPPSPASSPTSPDQPLYVVVQDYWNAADRKTKAAMVAGIVAVTAGTTYLVVKYRNRPKKGASKSTRSKRSTREAKAKTPSKSSKSKRSTRSSKSFDSSVAKAKGSKPRTPSRSGTSAKPGYQGDVQMALPPAVPTYTIPPPPDPVRTAIPAPPTVPEPPPAPEPLVKLDSGSIVLPAKSPPKPKAEVKKKGSIRLPFFGKEKTTSKTLPPTVEKKKSPGKLPGPKSKASKTKSTSKSSETKKTTPKK